MSMGLKPPVPWHPQLFQRRKGTKAHVKIHGRTDTELDAVPVQVHRSNLLQYKSALFHPRETKQVPRGLTYSGSASKAGFLSPCIFIWFFTSFSTSLFLPVCLPESLLFIYSIIPVCTDAGGSNARRALRIREQEHSLLPCQGRHIAASGAPGLCCAFPLQVGAGPLPLLCSRLLQHVPLQEPTPRWWQEPI